MSQAELAKAARLATRVTVGALENGMPVKDLTLSRIEAALGYRPGAFRRFLADGSPLELVDETPRESYTDPTERGIMSLEELPLEQRRQWVADLRAARARRREQQQSDDPDAGGARCG